LNELRDRALDSARVIPARVQTAIGQCWIWFFYRTIFDIDFGARSDKKGRSRMQDAVMLLFTVIFFAVAFLYVKACQKLR
jgi:hypothetical protein